MKERMRKWGGRREEKEKYEKGKEKQKAKDIKMEEIKNTQYQKIKGKIIKKSKKYTKNDKKSKK